MKLGFVAWNRFQIAQVAPIIMNKHADDIVMLFQRDRKGADVTILENPPNWCSTLSISRNETSNLDGVFDGILTQTSLPECAEFTKTSIIAVQYSMAKEKHQYGPWHFLTDASLTYGQYSDEIVGFYGKTYKVGNPRLDVLFNDKFDVNIPNRIKRQLDESKPTLLYVPTYGELSSIDAFQSAAEEICRDFNLIVSGHHNTMLRENSRAKTIEALNPEGSVDLTPYYHHVADVVVSDYSGAIFDALAAKKPVVLFRPDHESKIGKENLTEDSIEIARSEEIGPVVGAPMHLAKVARSHMNSSEYLASNASLRTDCFVNLGSAADASYEAIVNVVNNRADTPKTLRWTRTVLKDAKRR